MPEEKWSKQLAFLSDSGELKTRNILKHNMRCNLIDKNLELVVDQIILFKGNMDTYDKY